MIAVYPEFVLARFLSQEDAAAVLRQHEWREV
jgi:hypothetical protein